MAKEQTGVPDIFRRAQQIARENEGLSMKDLRRRLYDEFKDAPMPPLSNLTIPEQDARAPEEDWTAGLSLVRRGIQTEDWREIVNGIALSLDQTLTLRARARPDRAARTTGTTAPSASKARSRRASPSGCPRS